MQPFKKRIHNLRIIKSKANVNGEFIIQVEAALAQTSRTQTELPWVGLRLDTENGWEHKCQNGDCSETLHNHTQLNIQVL